MNPLAILLIGMVVVVGGILLLRLHAFLSLIAGALVVALLTPTPYLYRFELRAGAEKVIRSDAAGGTVTLKPKVALLDGTPLLVLAPAATREGYARVATLRVAATDASGLATAKVVNGDASLPELDRALVVEPATEAAADRAAEETIGQRIANGFGHTAEAIGILIAMAAIVGKTLMESGAAQRIVNGCRHLLGDQHAALAFLVSGFVLAALVTSDTTFYLLIPLAQVMRVRSGRDYLLYVLAIICGAVMTHSLVPPAPGPVFVAQQLHVNLFTMILGGVAVGAVASSSGYLYALWCNRRWEVPLRAVVGTSAEELAALATRHDSTLPPLWLSLAPIVVPVALIAAAAVTDRFPLPQPHQWQWAARRVIQTIGEKNMALTIAAIIGLLMVWSMRKRHTLQDATARRAALSAAIVEGVTSASVIILVISAGGAFGAMLQQTDIAASVQGLHQWPKLALLPLAFLVTAAIRTAQGSAIVAMITGTGIVAPIVAAGGLGFHPVYLALAIGCGSKPFNWMNDAGFWIICRMSGLTEGETLKTSSVLMSIMGVTGLGATMVGAWLWPMG